MEFSEASICATLLATFLYARQPQKAQKNFTVLALATT